MPNTIKIIHVCVDARTPFSSGSMFYSILNKVENIFEGAIKEAGSQYPDHASKFHKVPFYDEHETEEVFADMWILPEPLAKEAIAKATDLVKENEKYLSSSAYINVVECNSEELTLNEVTEADRLAQKYVSKSPALFTKAVRRIDGKSCFLNRTLEEHIKKFIDVPSYAVRGVDFYSTRGAKQVCDFDLLTYVYEGVDEKSRKQYIDYARAYPDDVIIAEDYESDRVFPKDIPLGNVSKADFLEAYWKVVDELKKDRR